MKDKKYKSFTRTTYYKGKLLQAEDYNIEQQYIKDKLRLLASLGHEAGVIEGLELLKAGEDELLLKPGMAMDHEGNIIVVPEQRRLKLNKFKGYEEAGFPHNMYAYLTYHERKIYNKELNKPEKIVETYRLGVTTELLPLRGNEVHYKIYDQWGVRVYLQFPEKSYENGKIKGKVFIDKPSGSDVSVSIRCSLQGMLTMDHQDRVALGCYTNEDQLFEESHYNFRIIANEGQQGCIQVEEIKVDINGEEELIEEKPTMSIHIGSKEEMEDHEISTGPIYLGRVGIGLDKGQEYIERLEMLPFKQNALVEYKQSKNKDDRPLVARTNLLKLLSTEEPRADVRYDEEKNQMLFTFGLPYNGGQQNTQREAHKMTTDTVRIELTNGGKAGRCYYSDYIEHGLGLGSVSLNMAVEEKMIPLSGIPEPEEQLIFGDFEVFDESECISSIPGHKLGAVLYPKEGRFKIGIKLNENTKLKHVNVRWWASKMADLINEVVEDDPGQQVDISIKPNKLELKKGQKVQLKATIENSKNKNVTWRILDQDGGKITQNGFYTAPNKRGVFKIEATSVADFSRTATVIVMIRDEG